MQNDIDKILNKRSFQNTDLNALNDRISNLAKETVRDEFETTEVKTNINLQIFLITACFAIGLFTGVNTQVDATISSDFDEYIYIEEGVI